MNILWQGSKGSAVGRLQKGLVARGCELNDNEGVFGPATKNAVVAFQKILKLPADGIAGPRTLAALGLASTKEVELVKTVGVPRVFVSYSHADVKWMKRLQVFLAPLERQQTIDVWMDTRIQPGQDWKAEIGKALNAAAVAVLLVSQDFMASQFITTNELPLLLAAAENRRTVILLVIISPCSIGGLSKYQAVNPPSKTMLEMDRAQRERVWLKVEEAVTAAVNRKRT